jgi:glycosyltransferase involved in cell wall biosynthesis
MILMENNPLINDKIHIVQLISGLDFGGAEQVVFDLAHHLQNRGYQIKVFSMLPRTQRLSAFRQKNIDTSILDMGQPWQIWKNLAIAWETHKILSRQKNVLIHAHMLHALVFAIVLKCLHPDRKIIFTRHNAVDAFTATKRVFFWLTKAFRQADIVFSHSELARRDVKNGVVIPNGVSEKMGHARIKNKNFIFLSVGMFRHQKNYQILPEIAKEMQESGFSAFEIWLCGDGETYEETKNSATILGVASHFQFIGASPDPDQYYAQAHAYILPSKWEGMPISVLEAAMFGLPAILTPVGSLVDHFDNDHVYFRRTEEFAQAMMDVANNYQEALKKGHKFKAKVIKMFSVNSMTEKHTDLYTQLN